MLEKDMRATLRDVLDKLDRHSNRIVKTVLIPSLLGAGLALGAGGCGHRAIPKKGSVTDATATQADSGHKKLDIGVLPPYMAPPAEDLSIDALIPDPQADYAAP